MMRLRTNKDVFHVNICGQREGRVVEHVMNGHTVYFCLNCDDWVKEKGRVFDQGWSLFDLDGNLNNFV